MPAISPTGSPRQALTSRSDRPLALDVQQRAGVEPSEHPAPMETSSESTLHCCLAEREDRTDPCVDHRTGVVLARLRALRQWLLRRNGGACPALGSCFPRADRRVLVGVLRQDRGTAARPLVALCPGWRFARIRPGN